MPSKSANVKNTKQYEALKDKGMSKERAAKIANTPDASKKGGKASGKGAAAAPQQGGTTAQKRGPPAAKGGKAAAIEGCVGRRPRRGPVAAGPAYVVGHRGARGRPCTHRAPLRRRSPRSAG